jgi:hypothetical protein
MFVGPATQKKISTSILYIMSQPLFSLKKFAGKTPRVRYEQKLPG